MTPADFEFICSTVRQRSGLVLTADKTYLVESRLMPIARRLGHESLGDFIGSVRRNPSEDILGTITEAMTTNESFFFRDKTPFDQFTGVMMPEVTKAREPGAPIRIWCAAASTGQEPYSLSILLKESPAISGGRKVEILGTDIAPKVLNKAKAGVYSQFEVQRGLPIQLLVKYFAKDKDMWQLSPEIRGMVTYQPFNLLESFASLGKFDIIFCRNVLIYFDAQTKKGVLERMAQVLAPDGYLVIGAAETVFGLTDSLQPMRGQRGLYVRSDNAAAAKPAAPISQPVARATSA